LKETVAYLAKTVSERDLPVTAVAAVSMMVSPFGHSVSRGALLFGAYWRLVHVNRSDTDYRVGR
jgi:hypothetical protein